MSLCWDSAREDKYGTDFGWWRLKINVLHCLDSEDQDECVTVLG